MKSLRITFLCLVLLSVGASLLNYHREHRHDDDTYLQELEHRLQCAEWVDYEDPFFGYAMRRPSCFLPAEAEGEGNVRFVYVEELPLRQVQYMTLDVTTEVCRDTLNPYRDMRRRAEDMDGVCLRQGPNEYLMTATLQSRNRQVTAYRLQAKYVLRQRMWFVETLIYPEDFAPAVGGLVKEVEQWKPFP
ncbi:MAG: hypothetical protein IJ762_00950 [Bacteroidaceae bacterium]|nr:hypothetical protein [Bacteroidaceae bacterium]